MTKKRFFVTIKMHLFVLALIAVIIFSACSKEEKQRPKEVLSESEMVDVMVDVHLAEAVLTRKRGENQEVEELSDKYYEEVFDKHNITKKTFDTSFTYYQKNLSNLQRIYEQVITELNKMQREREMIRKEKNDDSHDDSENKPDSNTLTRDLKMKLKESQR